MRDRRWLIRHKDHVPRKEALADWHRARDECGRGSHVIRDDVGRSQRDRMNMDRKAGSDGNRGITRARNGEAIVAETLFAANGCDEYTISIERQAKARFIAIRELAPEVE